MIAAQYAPSIIATAPGAPDVPETAGVAPLAWKGLTDQQRGWLALANDKKQLFDRLQAGELQVQQLLNVLPAVTPESPETLNTNLSVLQGRIKQAKQIASEHKEMRLSFTSMITERIIRPAMEFEQRSATLIDAAGQRELEMRKSAAEIAEKGAALKREENELIAFMSNEQIRIASDYRRTLDARVDRYYAECLQKRIPQPDMDYLRSELSSFAVANMNKFNLRLLSKERATEILNGLVPYDPRMDYDAVKDSLPTRFAMYQHDLANAEAAVKKIEEDAAKRDADARQDAEITMATNTLMAQAETAAVDAPKVKRKLEPVEENTQEWAFAVIAAFVKNSSACAPKLRVKSWGKLSIGQMAKALADVAGETGEVFHGIQFKEVEK